MAAAANATSATPAANRPAGSSDHEKHFMPTVGSSRKDGLYPATPQKAAGRTTEPPVWLPSAIGTNPAPTAGARLAPAKRSRPAPGARFRASSAGGRSGGDGRGPRAGETNDLSSMRPPRQAVVAPTAPMDQVGGVRFNPPFRRRLRLRRATD